MARHLLLSYTHGESALVVFLGCCGVLKGVAHQFGSVCQAQAVSSEHKTTATGSLQRVTAVCVLFQN